MKRYLVIAHNKNLEIHEFDTVIDMYRYRDYVSKLHPKAGFLTVNKITTHNKNISGIYMIMGVLILASIVVGIIHNSIMVFIGHVLYAFLIGVFIRLKQ